MYIIHTVKVFPFRNIWHVENKKIYECGNAESFCLHCGKLKILLLKFLKSMKKTNIFKKFIKKENSFET